MGILTKFIIHIFSGAPLTKLFVSNLKITQFGDGNYHVDVEGAAIFSNFISIKRKLDKIPRGKQVVLNLNSANLVDHTVMDHLHHYASEYAKTGGNFIISGLDGHKASSKHPLSARRLVSNSKSN